VGLPHFGVADEYITYAAKPSENADFQMKKPGERGHGVIAEERAVFLPEILSGTKQVGLQRQITYSGAAIFRRAVLRRGGQGLRAGERARTGKKFPRVVLQEIRD
jgi:hypothetical protein